MQLTCRFYKNQYPEADELVMVNVAQIEEMGVYVNLLEYNNIQGMILLTELTRRRIRSIIKLIRIGRNEVVVVVRVDPEKGFIDLSKRRASPEDIMKCEEKFARGKTVYSILRHTAEVLGLTTNEEFEELYDKTAWYYDEKYKRQGAAYDVFIRAVSNEHELDDCQIDENTKKLLLENIGRRLATQAVKCRADIEVACFGYEGIDAVKAALKDGLKMSTEDMPLKINLIAPPLYVVTTVCFDGAEGIHALKNAIEKVKQSIEQYRGIYKVKMEPKVVTAVEERALEEEYTPKLDDDVDDSDESEDDGIKGDLPGEIEFAGTTGLAQESTTVLQNDEDDDEED